jgi:PEP-CTERM motif
MNMKRILPVIATTVFVILLAPSGRADSFDVSVNTSALSGSPQVLAFSLTNNDGAPDNTISLSSFNFGTGGSAASGTEDCTLGGFLTGAGCSGNLTSGVTLTDSTTEAFFDQEFTAGSLLSFELATTNAFAGGIPDGFAMYLCNATLSSCYSDDSSTGAMLVLGLTGSPLTPSSFTLNAATAQGLPAPVVTAASGSTTAPEPPALLMLGLGILALAFWSRKREAAAQR